jgi:DMSO/TMAO reductase YedYZ heme-binding membrane subunit
MSGTGPRAETGAPDRTGGGVPVRQLWARAWSLAAALVVFGSVYFFIRQFFKDGVWRFDLTLVDKPLGVTALVLAAFSMALTGLVYFGWAPGRRLAMRKYYGLAAFWTGLAHGIVNHGILPATGLQTESGVGAWPAEAAGWAALAIFAVMALISDDRVRLRLGNGRWRRLLRYAGYAGLVAAAGHAALLKWPSWDRYFRTFGSVLPSLSLPAALLAAVALLLRLAVWISRRRKA